MKNVSSFFEKENFGKLISRIFFGLIFVTLGVRYFTEGISGLRILGHIFGIVGINFCSAFWGILSAFILIFSGICHVIGFYYKTNCGILALIFFLRTIASWQSVNNFFANEFLVNIFLSIYLFSSVFIGPGRLSADGR